MYSQELTDTAKVVLFIAICQKSVMANFHKAIWQRVKKKPADKLMNLYCLFLEFIVILPVSIGKGYSVVFYIQDSVVR